MKQFFTILVALLSISLVVQNTCPFGKAGKTAVGPACGHCPLHKLQCAASADNATHVLPRMSAQFPLFVFTPEQREPLALPALLDRLPAPAATSYTDAVAKGPLRPPRT